MAIRTGITIVTSKAGFNGTADTASRTGFSIPI